jgi:hypothetical protein
MADLILADIVSKGIQALPYALSPCFLASGLSGADGCRGGRVSSSSQQHRYAARPGYPPTGPKQLRLEMCRRGDVLGAVRLLRRMMPPTCWSRVCDFVQFHDPLTPVPALDVVSFN